MQYARETRRNTQLGLVPNTPVPTDQSRCSPIFGESQPFEENDSGYSEICLNGAPRQCLQWLAPVLRDLSQANVPGWLTLIDPPDHVSHGWLRAAGLDPQRILIVRPNRGMNSLALCCDILRLGYSHTVVSWLAADSRESAQMAGAARLGNCRSLNVRIEASRAA